MSENTGGHPVMRPEIDPALGAEPMPRDRIQIPAWVVPIVIGLVLSSIGSLIGVTYKLSAAATTIDSSVARIGAIESRLQVLSDLARNEAVSDEKLNSLLRRVERLEQLEDEDRRQSSTHAP